MLLKLSAISSRLQWFNSLSPEICGSNFENMIFKPIYRIIAWTVVELLFNEYGLYGPWCPLSPKKAVKLNHSLTLQWMPQNLIKLEVNIVSGNGLVPSGTKPLSEPMLTQVYVAILLSRVAPGNPTLWHRVPVTTIQNFFSWINPF